MSTRPLTPDEAYAFLTVEGLSRSRARELNMLDHPELPTEPTLCLAWGSAPINVRADHFAPCADPSKREPPGEALLRLFARQPACAEAVRIALGRLRLENL